MDKGRIPAALLALIVAVSVQTEWRGLRQRERYFFRKAGARSKGDNVGGHSPGTQQRRRRMARRRKGS